MSHAIVEANPPAWRLPSLKPVHEFLEEILDRIKKVRLKIQKLEFDEPEMFDECNAQDIASGVYRLLLRDVQDFLNERD